MKTEIPDSQKLIDSNIKVHDQVAQNYENVHNEIFNDIEQSRLSYALERALKKVRTDSDPLYALDFGCGSGNLTNHLLNLNVNVVAADVSNQFLALLRQRFPGDRLTTLKLNGKDMAGVNSNSFDFIATYSVLHHIPDYLGAIVELARVCKPGGVIYLDHEHTDQFWFPNSTYKEFKAAAPRFNWQKYLVLGNYVGKIRRLFNPRYANEGDIHVWPDDHIEWNRIEETLLNAGFEVVLSEEYLHFNGLYRTNVYKKYENLCKDMRFMAFRKRQY